MEDQIDEIGIDGKGRLYVKPATSKFPFIYREAMEVHWDNELNCLFGSKPRDWSYLDWYHQILKAASEQGCNLKMSSSVKWINVPRTLQKEISKR